MTDPIQTAQDACHAAIDRLADAGHRAANEHAYALDQLRQECEALRRQNQALRELLTSVQPVDTEAPVREVVIGAPRGSSMKFQMVAAPHNPDTLASGYRSAVDWEGNDKWEPFDENGNYPPGYDDGDTISRDEARRWVLDGVLP